MIVFYSNFINEHQIPFCEAMYKRTNGEFRFIATTPFDEERIKMGFEDKSYNFPYVIQSFKSNKDYEEALLLGRKSDVVILGDAPDVFIEERLKAGKLTFRYNERFFKEGKIRILDPRVFKWRLLNDFRYRNKNLHMLCASAYTAGDCRFVLSYPNKTYKWGYFPQVKVYEDIDSVIKSKQKATVLWAGRFLDWKRPDDVIKAVAKLKTQGYNFSLQMIGQGDMEEKVKSLISKYQLEDYVTLLGFMPPEEVRKYMEKADIYLFTSDQNEGWGAVLNESMNSACAVVANKEIGSVPYLLKNGENGLVYNRKKKDDLANKIALLLDDEKLKMKLQKNAYQTLLSTWNADVAAERLLNLIDDINNGKEIRYKDGPCSRD